MNLPRSEHPSSFWKWMWLSAVLHNAVGALGLGLFQEVVFGHFDSPAPGVFYDVWIGFVAVFAIAYALVYRDPLGTRYLVVLGIMAKLASALPQLVYLLLDPSGLPPIFWIPIVTDTTYSLLFFVFLRRLD
jgi:hypothetical protein